MTQLGPTARSLVQAARKGDRSTLADRDRVRARLTAAIAATAAVGLGAKVASGAPAALKTTAPWLLALKLAAPIVIASAVGVVVARTPSQPPVATQSTAAVEQVAARPARAAPIEARPVEARPNEAQPIEAPPAPVVVDAPKEAKVVEAPAQPAPRVAPVAPRADRVAAAAPPREINPATPDDPLTAEIGRLQKVDAALRGGEADRALALLDEGGTGGELREERSAARAIALCKTGRVAEGQRAMTALATENAQSPLLARVHAACDAK